EHGGRLGPTLEPEPSWNLVAPAARALCSPDSAQTGERHRVQEHLQPGQAVPRIQGRGYRLEGPGEPRKAGRKGRFLLLLDRLSISYCRSSGPGGQNVNKVNSKAEVRFHLASADWIAEPVRQKIALTHKNKINKAGELVLTSESSRYQFRNLAECLQKIRDMIAKASQVPKEPSKEDAQLQRLRIEKMNRERLRQKRINSTIKTSRRMTMD
uniref:Large ribosomal subunit protein mL62 n=1 Tax=Rattus norvegicus TaxID=10116 RepID=A0A8I6A3T5_RAT